MRKRLARGKSEAETSKLCFKFYRSCHFIEIRVLATHILPKLLRLTFELDVKIKAFKETSRTKSDKRLFLFLVINKDFF